MAKLNRDSEWWTVHIGFTILSLLAMGCVVGIGFPILNAMAAARSANFESVLNGDYPFWLSFSPKWIGIRFLVGGVIGAGLYIWSQANPTSWKRVWRDPEAASEDD